MKKKPRLVKPINRFKQKVGTGGIDEKLLDDAQTLIEETKIDFSEYAFGYLETLDKIIKQAKKDNKNNSETINKLIRPIMQLKANGGMFRYHLVTEIADIILNFLEEIEKLDNDVYKVIDVHKKTIQVIISNKLTGDGGKEGYELAKELDKACKRYIKKHSLQKETITT